jgi:hypothetical protein
MRQLAVLFLCLLAAGCGGLAPRTSSMIANPTPLQPAPSVPTPSPRCASDRFDMLDWMTLDEDLRSNTYLHGVRPDGSNANDLYTMMEADRFYWMKSPQGWPWDIELFDDDGIYDWITEYSWTDPYSFKKSMHDKNKKWATRCMKAGDRVMSADTSYEINSAECGKNGNQTIHDLKNMITTVEGVQQVSLGGDMAANMSVLVFDYDYVCDEKFQHCKDRERYLFEKRYGLVYWEHRTLGPDRSTYNAPDNVTIFNQIKHGTPPIPQFPCQ